MVFSPVPVSLLEWANPAVVLQLFLINTRLSGLLVTAPLFQSPAFTVKTKLLLSVALSLLLFFTVALPLGPATFNVLPRDIPQLAVFMVQELLIGVCLGFAINLLLETLMMAGEVISVQSGLSMAQQLDPIRGQQSPIVGQLLVQGGLMILLGLDLHRWILILFEHTYKVIPLGQMGHWLSAGQLGALIERLLLLGGMLWTTGLLLATPMASILLMVEVSLAFVNRMMPQMNVFMVSMPLKLTIGFWVLTQFLTVLEPVLSQLLKRWLPHWSHLFG
jgi:flagellar biosynthesis protein FliR